MNYSQQREYRQFILNHPGVSQTSEVIVEHPVTLSVNGEEWVAWMCTPLDIDAMAVGFLFNEGVIESIDEIEHLRLCDAGDQMDVWLTHKAEKPRLWRRTSGCSGGYTAVVAQPPHLSSVISFDGKCLTPEQVTYLVAALFENQQVYRQTGGVHTSALSDGERILAVAEDVGRHNTLDKLAGRILLERLSPEFRVILTTGRISSEMLQKASRIGAQMVISRTAPTSLSIQIAHERNITLIGYARRDRFNVYTHPERICTPETAGQIVPSQSDKNKVK